MAGPIPFHLRDASYSGATKLGHGQGYAYAHDDPSGVVAAQYAPDGVDGKDYYRPTEHGAEAGMSDRLSKLRAILRRRS